MTEATQTTCPHCESSLPVMASQLQQAGGRVRCGNCLQIFHAATGNMDFVPPVLPDSTEAHPLADFTDYAAGDTQAPQRTLATLLAFAMLSLLILSLAAQVYFRLNSSSSRAGMDIRQLIVRNHPLGSGSLRLDAILRNSGDQHQQLPALDLVFSNQLGEPLAQRSFTPREYLHGLDGRVERLAGHSEIQISLRLQNPGPEAINYSASLRAVTASRH
jgi:predicted Zn finger-like uncharacterized protein